MRGGVPITVDGQIVGAIGVSADIPEHDVVIADAGIAALTKTLERQEIHEKH
jgi:glc operon protein GlcG